MEFSSSPLRCCCILLWVEIQMILHLKVREVEPLEAGVDVLLWRILKVEVKDRTGAMGRWVEVEYWTGVLDAIRVEAEAEDWTGVLEGLRAEAEDWAGEWDQIEVEVGD